MPGEKVICQHDCWYNAHGDEFVIGLGERLTIRGTYRVGGALFYRFEGIESGDNGVDPGFLSTGFRSLKGLN